MTITHANRTRLPWLWIAAAGVALALVGAVIGILIAVATPDPGLVDTDPAGFRACQAVDSYLHHTLFEDLAVEFIRPDVAVAKTRAIRSAGTDLRALHDACVDAGYKDMPPWS